MKEEKQVAKMADHQLPKERLLPLETHVDQVMKKPNKSKDVEEIGRSRPSSPTAHQDQGINKISEYHRSKSEESFSKKAMTSDNNIGSQSTMVSSYSCSSLACKDQGARSSDENGRERLKRHRIEMAGRVWIPDIWGQEELLKDWIDCSAFDAGLMASGIISARNALVEEGRRASSGGLRIENRC